MTSTSPEQPPTPPPDPLNWRDLLRAGVESLEPTAAHPRPTSHRAVSTACYAAFHAITASNAPSIIPQPKTEWLGDDGPQFTLLLALDDATSAVVNAVFSPEEDTRSYFILIQGLIQRCGQPIGLYGDRNGVFKFSGNPRHIQPPVKATHFSKAIAELGIQQIFARSP